MKRFKLFFSGLVLIFSFLSYAQDQDLVQLKNRIHQDVTISNSELDGLDLELNEFQKRNGDVKELSKLIKNAQVYNCVGNCLKEAISSMNYAIDQNSSSSDAQTMVSETIKLQKNQMIGKSQEAQGDLLRKKVHDQLRIRNPSSHEKLNGDRLRTREHRPVPLSGDQNMKRKGI